jgi:hypothetical protein
MSNLIPADKLISEIEMRIAQWQTYTFACASQIASEAFDRIDELKGLLIYITSLQQEQPEVNLEEELKDMVARNAASIWCRCFKCDGIINATSSKCNKEKLLTCRKWYDGYRTALLALGDKRIFNARKEE